MVNLGAAMTLSKATFIYRHIKIFCTILSQTLDSSNFFTESRAAATCAGADGGMAAANREADYNYASSNMPW